MNLASRKGYLYAVAAALLWASSGTAGKALFVGGIAPFDVVQARVTLSAALLAVLLGIFRPSALRIRLRDGVYFLILGGIISVLVQLSYFYAISKIHVAAAILLQYLAPILVAAVSFCFLKERVSLVKISALILALIGCYLVVGGYSLDLVKMNRTGITWGLISACAFATYTLLGEYGMRRYGPWTVLFYSFLFGTLSLALLHGTGPYESLRVSARQAFWLVYIAVAGTLIPFGLYFMAIDTIRSTKTVITATLEPISAALMAFLFVGEILEPLQLIGGILVISAVVLLQLGREKDTLAPESMRLAKKR